MKVKINAIGQLEIWRAGNWKMQACPQQTHYDQNIWWCGDWCPRFGEPEREMTTFGETTVELIRFRICDVWWNTSDGDTILDERPKGENA